MKIRTLSFLLVLAIAGCATLGPNQARVTINSSPPGATISGNGFSEAAPVEKTCTAGAGQTSCKAQVTATWVSGATTTQVINATVGQYQQFTLTRPNAPGLQQDLQWAMQLQNQKAQAQRDSNQAIQNFVQQQQAQTDALNRAARQNAPVQTNCTRNGNQVNCTSY